MCLLNSGRASQSDPVPALALSLSARLPPLLPVLKKKLLMRRVRGGKGVLRAFWLLADPSEQYTKLPCKHIEDRATCGFDMVCAKCEAAERSKKVTGLACTDVWKPDGVGSDQRNERKIGSNKLLEAKRRYAAMAPSGERAIRKGAGGSTSVGAIRRGAGSNIAGQPFNKCDICKVTVAKEGAHLCQRE